MSEIYQYLVAHKVVAIVFAIVVAVVIVYLAVKILQTVGLEKIRATVYKAFIAAENSFKHGDNKAKFEYVINIAKQAIPAPFNLLITEALLRKTVQLWFDLCKDLLDDGKLNGTGKTQEG